MIIKQIHSDFYNYIRTNWIFLIRSLEKRILWEEFFFCSIRKAYMLNKAHVDPLNKISSTYWYSWLLDYFIALYFKAVSVVKANDTTCSVYEAYRSNFCAILRWFKPVHKSKKSTSCPSDDSILSTTSAILLQQCTTVSLCKYRTILNLYLFSLSFPNVTLTGRSYLTNL